jgi:phosphoadenosine phosphosulfate reductase
MPLDGALARAGRGRDEAAALAAAYDGLPAEAVLEAALTRDLGGRIALVSSFGAEAAVLLHMAAAIDRAVPVLFGDTGKLFPETLAYQRTLAERLGLTDLRVLRPDPAALAVLDAGSDLHARDATLCCHVRKVEPLETALAPFDAWITGRKRAQSATRAALGLVETDAAGRIKLNPLADWTAEDVRAYMRRHDLPAHPLVARGFPSIGCAPCTTPVAPGEHPRAGRWRGQAKDECGIHVENGRIVRVPADAAPMDRV